MEKIYAIRICTLNNNNKNTHTQYLERSDERKHEKHTHSLDKWTLDEACTREIKQTNTINE